ncbi:MAG TPA: ribosome assembly cofactor RimP, partial [Dysgonamonadaceae bacterium]|nr:ribosome assembly cofactor RimP [Dysgonamonadaceae bacterium]
MINRDVIRELVEAFLKESNNYLVDIIVYPGNSIMVEIDNDEGVAINDCEALSRYIESNLDREIEDFDLTISSAGLTSPFKTTRQYKKYIGKEIETLTKKGEKLKGTLKEADDTGFTLMT